jgi:hypothetical protein
MHLCADNDKALHTDNRILYNDEDLHTSNNTVLHTDNSNILR